MKKFLHWKHWQLFGMLVIVPLLVEAASLVLAFTADNPNAVLPYFFIVLELLICLCMAVFFGWFWALGVGLHARLSPTVKVNLTRFKIFLLIPVIYITFMSIFTLFFLQIGPGDGDRFQGFLYAIIPLHLFAMFCVFYCFYFIAKELKSVELQRSVTFGDFAGEFFLIWFYPIGIWIIQPRVNRLFEHEHEEHDLQYSGHAPS
jgi:hypothetical protein